MKYKVIEKFTSINGEGLRSGELTTFVRFFGCNLRCAFCDSAYTYDKDEKFDEMTLEEIVEYVKGTGIRNVTLAGGEPLFQPNIFDVVSALCAEGLHVEIETNGAFSVVPFLDIENRPSFTLDYKTGCSGGMSRFMDVNNYRYIDKRDSVKFVCGSVADLEQMLEVVQRFGLIEKTNVLVSPCYGEINPLEIVDFLKEHTLNGIKMQLQIHKVIWDAEERGV